MAQNSISVSEMRALAVVKAHKYGAVKTVVDGILFDSKAEAARYQDVLFGQRLA